VKFRRKQNDVVDVNITPLIDIVFLLLIFFMVSTTFDEQFELGIVLPGAESAENVILKELEIAIDAEGHYYINQQRLVNDRIQTLQKAISKIAGEDRTIPIILSADANTPHQSVITAMDAVRQLGFNRLSFATQQLSAQP